MIGIRINSKTSKVAKVKVRMRMMKVDLIMPT
jgi:hypothetical protein